MVSGVEPWHDLKMSPFDYAQDDIFSYSG